MVLPYLIAIAIDAVTKASHFFNSSKSTKGLKPVLSMHFGPADNEVQRLHAAGQLDTQELCGSPAAVEEAGAGACTSDLHCARPSAQQQRGKVDQHGIVGTTCVHGTPMRGGFISMPVLENFAYYLIMLRNIVLAKAGGIHHVYVDFACQLRSTWARYLQHLREKGGLSEQVRQLSSDMTASLCCAVASCALQQ